jgi:hypothetical protein
LAIPAAKEQAMIMDSDLVVPRPAFVRAQLAFLTRVAGLNRSARVGRIGNNHGAYVDMYAALIDAWLDEVEKPLNPAELELIEDARRD